MNNFTPEVHDEAMQSFREAFYFPLMKCHVLKDGKLMRFRLSSDRLARVYLSNAQCVIDQGGLPLEAKIDSWEMGGVVFDRWLVIEFNSAKLIPEAY
jgi:hypothetical protein